MKKIKSICIIDDEDINQFILKTMIQTINKEIEILIYNNGESALTSFSQKLLSQAAIPDIILLDINMPIMNGWEFLDEFVKLKPKIDKKIEIYIISSSSAPDDVKKAEKYTDIYGYLNRPIETFTLKEIIEKN